MRTILVLIIFVPLGLLYIPVIFFSFIFRISRPVSVFGKFGIRLAKLTLGIRVNVSGLEGLNRKQAYVVMSNHLSLLDGPLLYMLFPYKLSVILKQEILRVPIVGSAMRRVNFVPVDRKGIRGGRRSLDQAVRLMREKFYSFLIFPEGTRSRNGRLQSFRRGGFFLALESRAPIVPVSISGTYGLQPRKSFFIKKGTVEVKFFDPISVEEYDRDSLPELMSRVRRIIAAAQDDKGENGSPQSRETEEV